MKQKEWANANKMIFESGYRAFDRQTTFIGTGSVIADTQLSFHIRPRNKTECYGYTFPKGHLRGIDIKNFLLPSRVHREVMRLTEMESVILYQFHHRDEGDDRQVIHGYIITTPRPEHRLLLKIVTGPTYRSGLVIAEAAKYVAD